MNPTVGAESPEEAVNYVLQHGIPELRAIIASAQQPIGSKGPRIDPYIALEIARLEPSAQERFVAAVRFVYKRNVEARRQAKVEKYFEKEVLPLAEKLIETVIDGWFNKKRK